MANTDTPTGRDATSPWRMPGAAWLAIFKRTWSESGTDNLGLIAAGVAFYGFVALVPLLGALVLSYGLIAEPSTVVEHMRAMTSVMPAEAAKLIGDQLMNVVHTSAGKKGLGVLLALALALFGARNGASAIVTALNIAYEEKEKRGFIRLNLLALAITAGAVVLALGAMVAIAALGHLNKLVPQGSPVLLALAKIVSYVLLALGGAAAAATLYRFGPSRAQPRWVWITPGSLFAAVVWLLLTLGFGVYVANFGNYNATYGSLGAVVVLLTWLYLSSYILLFGAELNSQIEHQTARDTTTGPERAIGKRDAWAADHVAGEGTATDEADRGSASAAGARAPETAVAASAAPQPGSARDVAVTWIAARVARMIGLKSTGMLGSGTVVFGLSLIRARRSAGAGLALLGAAAGWAWLQGPPKRATKRGK